MTQQTSRFPSRDGSARLGGRRDNDFTKILGWPGYRVYRHEINEAAKTLRLWARRKRGNRKLICSGCWRTVNDAHDFREREVRDLPWGKYRTTVIIEVYRVCSPQCGVRVEKVRQLPGKAPLVSALRNPWGWCAKARRYDRLPDSSDWLPARCERSTCGICSAGV